jgi:hypothetical protein
LPLGVKTSLGDETATATGKIDRNGLAGSNATGE